MSKQVTLKKPNLSPEVMDFVNRLLERKHNQRLGYEGPDEVMNHPWLKGVNWSKHYDKDIEPPYKIISKDNYDAKFVNKLTDLKEDRQYTDVFHGFTYNEFKDE
jgi:p70 ribosomal S6 kinase/serum/glucocorticoid-regulated kinase 2